MKYISWFAGIGGFDVALNEAGWSCVGACEIDRFARHVYETKLGRPGFFPEDLGSVRADEIPDADLWCAGFPCQDVSVAGARAGVRGQRSGLIFELLELAGVKKPRFILLENVPGLLLGSDEEEDDEDRRLGSEHEGVHRPAAGSVSWFGALLGALADVGYVGAWRVLDSRYFGVPQRRRRVFILAGRVGDRIDPGEVLLEPESRQRDPHPSLAPRSDAAAATRGGAEAIGPLLARSGRNQVEEATGGQLIFEKTHHAVDRNDPEKWAPAHVVPTVNGHDFEGTRHPVLYVDAQAFEARVARNGRGAPSAVVAPLKAQSGRSGRGDGAPLVLQDGRAIEKYQNGLGMRGGDAYTLDTTGAQAVAYNVVPESGQGADLRVSETELAMALTAEEAKKYERGTRVQDGVAVRRLTPMEAELLQGFEPGWTCLCDCEPYSTLACRCPDGPRYKALGNAVTTRVVRWIAERLNQARPVARM